MPGCVSTSDHPPVNASGLRVDTATLERALARAAAERLVAYPTCDSGVWKCKDYQVVLTGPGLLDVQCDCGDCVYRERLCKHSVCVVFARKYGLRPVRPAVTVEGTDLPHHEHYQ